MRTSLCVGEELPGSNQREVVLSLVRRSSQRRLDPVEDARAAYDRALEFVHSDAERRFLERRLGELNG